MPADSIKIFTQRVTQAIQKLIATEVSGYMLQLHRHLRLSQGCSNISRGYVEGRMKMKDEFTLSASFPKCGCARILFSNSTKQKSIDFVDYPEYQYYVIGWFIDIEIGFLEDKTGEHSLYTEDSTMPEFISFKRSLNTDGNFKLRIEEVPAGIFVEFVVPLNQYVEQVIKLFDDNIDKFTANENMAIEYYGENSNLENLRKTFHCVCSKID